MSCNMRKPGFLHMQKPRVQIRLAVSMQLINAFVFTTYIGQFHYFLYTKFQASSLLCCCTAHFVLDLVGNPKDWFSCNTAHVLDVAE